MEWFEEYRCGCVSEWTRDPKDLAGYCGTHGEDVRHVHSRPIEEEERD